MNVFSCREATRLMSDAMDRPLTVAEKLALRGHLLICRFCRRCEKEFRYLRELVRGFSEKADLGTVQMPDDAKERVSKKLRL